MFDLTCDEVMAFWSEPLGEIPQWFAMTALSLAKKRAADVFERSVGNNDSDRYKNAIESGERLIQGIEPNVLWIFNDKASREQANQAVREYGYAHLMLMASKRLKAFGYIDVVISDTTLAPNLCDTITRLHERRAIRQIRAFSEFEQHDALEEFTQRDGVRVLYYPEQSISNLLSQGHGFVLSSSDEDPLASSDLIPFLHNWTRILVE